MWAREMDRDSREGEAVCGGDTIHMISWSVTPSISIHLRDGRRPKQRK